MSVIKVIFRHIQVCREKEKKSTNNGDYKMMASCTGEKKKSLRREKEEVTRTKAKERRKVFAHSHGNHKLFFTQS